MIPLGDKPVGGTVYVYFDSYGANGESASITGLAVTDIEVYKNGSTTQRASDNGYALLDTDGIDFDGTVGLNGFSIDTSDNSDAGFWAAGSHYLVNVNSVTANSQTVRFSYEFTLGLNLRPATAGRTLVVDAAGLADATAVKLGPSGSATAQTARDVGASVLLSAGTGTGQLDFTSGVVKTNVTQFGGVAGTFLAGRPEVNTTHVGGTLQTAGDIIADTNDLQARLPAALVGGRIDASVGALAANTVTAAALATDAVTEIQAGLSTLTAAGVRTELATELGRIDVTVSSRATPAQVNTEVVDCLSVDTYAEPTAPPAATATLAAKLGWLAILARNRVTQSSTTQIVTADNGSTTVGTAALSDDGTTNVRGEWA